MTHTPTTDALILAHGPNPDAIRAALRLAGHTITRRGAMDRYRRLRNHTTK